MEGSFGVSQPSLSPETSSDSWRVQTSVHADLEFPLNVNTRGMELRHMLSSNCSDPAALQVSAERLSR